MTAAVGTTARSNSAIQWQVISGLIASLALGMWSMIVEAILAGGNFVAGLFSPVVYIAATVLGGFGNPNFYPAGQLPPADPVAIVLGLMGHMMNSVVFAFVFFAIVSRFASTNTARVVVGLVYGVVIFMLMWYVALPIVDPVMLRVNYLGFFAGHMMYGIALGLLGNWKRPS